MRSLPLLAMSVASCATSGPVAVGAPPAAEAEQDQSSSVLSVAPVAARVRRRFDLTDVLYPEPTEVEPPSCPSAPDSTARARCLFEGRYREDPRALATALTLFETTGSAAGVEVERDFDGHYRGIIHLTPQVPLGTYRTHLDWVADALADQAEVLQAVQATAPSGMRFREDALELRFFRSVGRRTPSAIASGWTVSYNVAGSLNTSRQSVNDTLFHEVFHLNDHDHGDWSRRRLETLYEGIVAECGTRSECLTPYAPGTTRVRGGTYYAFQPNNGVVVREYAAELALRWIREQRTVLRGEVVQAPFKCGTPENAEAWEALVTEFFGGGDLVPPCGDPG